MNQGNARMNQGKANLGNCRTWAMESQHYARIAGKSNAYGTKPSNPSQYLSENRTRLEP